MTETSFAKKSLLRAAMAVFAAFCLSGCVSMDHTARNDSGDCQCANCQNQVQSIDMGPAIDMMGQPQAMMSPPTCELTSAEQYLPVTNFPSSDDVFSPDHSQYMPPAPDSCEAQLKAAKAEFDRRLLALETQVDQEKHDRKSVDRHLVAMNREVNRLSQEIDHWRSEVRRIDRTTEQQHRSDMASLQMISDMVDQIVAEREASGQRSPSHGASTR